VAVASALHYVAVNFELFVDCWRQTVLTAFRVRESGTLFAVSAPDVRTPSSPLQHLAAVCCVAFSVASIVCPSVVVSVRASLMSFLIFDVLVS